MTILLTAIGYQIVAIVYAVFSGFVVLRGSHTRVARFFLAALLATAFWAEMFVFATRGIVPVLAFDVGGALRDGSWLAFSLALMYPVAGNRNYWRAAAGIAAALIFLQLFLYITQTMIGVVAGVRIDVALMRV